MKYKRIEVTGVGGGKINLIARRIGKRLAITESYRSYPCGFKITHLTSGYGIPFVTTLKHCHSVFEKLDAMPEWDKITGASDNRSKNFRAVKSAVREAFTESTRE